VLAVDVAELLREVSVPVLYLRAKYDRVVPRSASALIARCLPRLKVIELDGPHFLLQALPGASAAHLHAFADEIGFAL
jgi:pimeloyl-ACP methyl ester carboxylesterase